MLYHGTHLLLALELGGDKSWKGHRASGSGMRVPGKRQEVLSASNIGNIHETVEDVEGGG